MRIFLVLVLLLILLILGELLLTNQSQATTTLAVLPFHPVSPIPISPTSMRSVSADDHVVGPPTITADFINHILAFYHSPAKDTGQALYADGRKYHIDPAFALAFFLHESRFGTTGVARVTKSLGNIRCSAGYQCIDGYRAYHRWEDSYQDWYQLILYGYIQGSITIPLVGHVCLTVRQIIPVYAPSSDGNDVEGYIRAVEQAVSIWRSGKMEVSA